MSEPGLRADLVGVRPGQLLFVDFHVADSYRLARAMLRDASSATDVVADAFVIFLWGSLTGVEGNRGLGGERGHASESRSVKRPLPVLAGSVK